MSKTMQYFRPYLPKSMEKAIINLYEKNPTIAERYNNNPKDFVEDATRRLLNFYDPPSTSRSSS